MEAIIEIAKYVGNSVFSYVDYHRKLEEDMNDLRSEFQVLKRRKIDVNSRIQAEVHWGQLVKEEVRGWFQDVEKIDDDIQVVEERVRRVSYFSRARLSKLVREKTEMVKRIQERGSFSESLSIDRAPTPGIIIPAENLEDEISKEKIWGHLMGDDVGMIGVYGIGGVGKTTIMKHVNNDLLKETKFHKVAWVTVSYPLNVFELQNNIARALCEKLPEDEEEMRRAAALMDIMGRMRFVLILDDVWEKFSLKDVGIPEPTMQNGCKVVITSRSAEICDYLGCKIVKVQSLSPEKSLNLFLNKVGRDVLQVPKLEEIVKLIVEECAGLPLAIVVIAGSMRGEYGINVWRNALNELRERVQSVNGSDNEIFEQLRFSYDRLNSSEIQKCFLYCSMFREDYPFRTRELIEGWIDEGLINGLLSRKAAYERGHAFLNRLVKNCLLEKTVDWSCDVFKMHDVVRDMAIKSIGLEFGYMVKAGMKLIEVPDERGWRNDLKVVSLMQNNISKIPLGLSPKCPTLSTLILSANHNLLAIPESFFEGMSELKVLDLSRTAIETLPNSISNLENLSALLLEFCWSLKYLPSLAKLTSLKKLNLRQSGIDVVPQGMEKLISLEYLDLYRCKNLKEIPMGMLSSLSHLQYLVVDAKLKVKVEELSILSKLETFEGVFDEIQGFNYFVKSQDFQILTDYRIVVGAGLRLYDLIESIMERDKLMVLIYKCEMGGEYIVLPDNLQYLRINECEKMRSSLNKTALLEKATQLSYCRIEYCEDMECVVDLDSSCCPVLDKLEELFLIKLPNLSALVRMEGVATPLDVFSSLKILVIQECSGMRKLLPLELLQAFQNLEKIEVSDCEQMEEIIASSDSNASLDKFTFSKLRVLHLWNLPQLENLCSANGVMVYDSIEEIWIDECKKLRRIPVQLPLLDNGQPSPPPRLRQIKIDEESKEWWESVEWDHKNLLQPFLQYTG